MTLDKFVNCKCRSSKNTKTHQLVAIFMTETKIQTQWYAEKAKVEKQLDLEKRISGRLELFV